jgi:hypothetical protein
MSKLRHFVRAALGRSQRLLWAKRHMQRKIRLRSGQPSWLRLTAEDKALLSRGRDTAAPRVLIATSIGGHLPATTLESALAAALMLRGAGVDILLCDGLLPACLACDATAFPSTERFADEGPQQLLCADCYEPAREMFQQLGLRVLRYSQLLQPNDYERARHFSSEFDSSCAAEQRFDGLAAGEHALAGTLRFFARADLEEEPHALPVLRRFAEAAALSVLAGREAFRRQRYECVLLHHGIYIPQGTLAEAARDSGVRVVTWNPAYRKRCFVFSHDDTYHRTLLDEPVSEWEGLSISAQQEQMLMTYLSSRAVGSYDWIWFHDRPNFDRSAVYKDLGLNPARPIIGLLTNVAWDARLHYSSNVFSGMIEWLIETVRYFSRRPELQLLIRVHPAELRGTLPSRQRVEDELKKAFGALPENVAVVPPDSNLSTYTAAEACDTVIIYGTKTGVELTSVGIPVIVAGEGWVRNKGISIDPESREAYFRQLDQLPLQKRMPPDQVARARRYAFHFFFRRMIPLEFMESAPGWPPYRAKVEHLSDLLPGRSKGLDLICSGILSGTEFTYPAETMPIDESLDAIPNR